MKLTTVLFDLDGTLLPMDQEVFVKTYLDQLAKFLVPHGYDPQAVVKAIWAGTEAMMRNTGAASNEEVFWNTFCGIFGEDARKDEPLFRTFYETKFQEVKSSCGFNPKAAETLIALKERGLRLVLATNPLFPAIATESRIRWAGLQPGDFELYTTYENACRCKPNPDYYRDILEKIGVAPAECLMVGNDVDEDGAAAKLGMDVFFLTECLINRHNTDLTGRPQGSLDDLLAYIDAL